MSSVIVGLGYFGKIIQSKLENVKTVDPYNEDSDYKTIQDVPFSDGKWFVTTPASTHYKVLLELFEKGVKDIWVEKPICSNFKDTLDIFSKIPDDVFLYCDFTWLKHSAIQSLGECKDTIKHIELKWLNDGSITPKDVNIVLDLVIHPLSIVHYFFIKSKDTIKNIELKYSSEKSVLLSGCSDKNVTFNIEVSNSSFKKRRNISLYCEKNVYRWFSENEFFIENIGQIEKSDAIEKNIKSFFQRINIGYSLDIARTLETVNKLFCS
jgi:predicted dehydrogenase